LFQAKSYVPKALEHYVDQLAKGLQEPQWPENVDPLKLLSIGSSSAAAAASAQGVHGVVDPFGVGVHGQDVLHVRGAGTPTASISTGFSDSEDDLDDHDDDVDNSDVDVN